MELMTHLHTSSSAAFVRDLEWFFSMLDVVERYVAFDSESAAHGVCYVQAILGEGGSVLLHSTAGADVRETLARLGFSPPSPDVPTWHLEVRTDMPGWRAMLAERTLRTFVDVHGWQPGDTVVAQGGDCLCPPEDLMSVLLPR
jgi:hypothetical protein